MSSYIDYFYWFCTFYVSVKLLTKLWTLINQYVLTNYKELDYKSFGQWAVITGSTDGIGKGFARGLAGKGVDICLISRSEEKLKNTAKEIEETYGVKTKYIVADFTNPNIYDHIRENIAELDVGILVNNVGMINDDLEPFSSQTEQFTKDCINVRITSVTMMSSLVIPCMTAKKRGLIINISSFGSEIPLPYLSEYCGIKSFVTKFGQCLHYELKKQNIQVTTLIPGMIYTKMLDKFDSSKRLVQLLLPFGILPVDSFVEKALNVIKSKCSVSCGYILYDVMLELAKLLPSGLITEIAIKARKMKSK